MFLNSLNIHTYLSSLLFFSYEFKHCWLLISQKLFNICKEHCPDGTQWKTLLAPLFLKNKKGNKDWEITLIKKRAKCKFLLHISFRYIGNPFCQISSCVPLSLVSASSFLSGK
jgi:hypothetical protein